jgi:hypothetical protein
MTSRRLSLYFRFNINALYTFKHKNIGAPHFPILEPFVDSLLRVDVKITKLGLVYEVDQVVARPLDGDPVKNEPPECSNSLLKRSGGAVLDTTGAVLHRDVQDWYAVSTPRRDRPERRRAELWISRADPVRGRGPA